ncbi:hypothetical protein [Anaerobium acetethylicum]|uniref:Uncharacterized protein n=1 Tax=Anaerobium acetethylicum TaxID=1619234 RepID=A0A1D3TXS6_9FIRM|nr:hypothetical protein [Anaerobium acetethylicum]SCP99164.1 hypothetical protein SAMN05421730_103327 [Anaerobium acetethylicum]
MDLKKYDLDYYIRRCGMKKVSAPLLMRKYRELFQLISFTESVTLSMKHLEDSIIIAVKLRNNNSVVCNTMRTDETVFARRFIGLAGEKD